MAVNADIFVFDTRLHAKKNVDQIPRFRSATQFDLSREQDLQDPRPQRFDGGAIGDGEEDVLERRQGDDSNDRILFDDGPVRCSTISMELAQRRR